MIKCSVTINGTISRAAQMRTDKDNNSFVSFPVSVVLPAKSGINKTVEVSVSMSGTQTDCPKFQPNQRVEMQGMLTLRKKGMPCTSTSWQAPLTSNPPKQRIRLRARWSFVAHWAARVSS